jgi:hypothetical protein
MIEAACSRRALQGLDVDSDRDMGPFAGNGGTVRGVEVSTSELGLPGGIFRGHRPAPIRSHPAEIFAWPAETPNLSESQDAGQRKPSLR